MFLNENMRSVVILACEKHASRILEKINQGEDGNWFILPSASLFKTGYWPNVSHSHSCSGCAIFGFMENEIFRQKLAEFDSENLDSGVCPDCAIYEWPITSLHSSRSTRDPVCRRVVPCSSSLSHKYHDRLYFFCSMNCRDEFKRRPSEFVTSETETESPPKQVIEKV